MPGDPFGTVKFIAERYLTDVKVINTVRNMFDILDYIKIKE